MKLASLDQGRDGSLVVVSVDGRRFAAAQGIAETLQQALDDWAGVEPGLRRLAERLEAGEGQDCATVRFAAPLPRAWQWLDGSAFPSHGALMDRVLGVVPEKTGLPLMYQGLSDRFIAADADVPLPSEDDGIDFEGEFAVVTDAVPMGVTPAQAIGLIRLVVQVNDWSLRMLAGREMKTGFGWVQAKPACSMAPFAVTPDALGAAWRDGRVHLTLHVRRGEQVFGAAHGGAMEFGFHDLIAHAARTRSLPAGTIVGSGTVSNADYREVGSSCIAERRGIEIIDRGAPETPFLSFGEQVWMEARDAAGTAPFGALCQRVVPAMPNPFDRKHQSERMS